MFFWKKDSAQLQANTEAIKALQRREEVSKLSRTIEDYGAVVYKNERDALAGKSSSDAIMEMINDVGTAILPVGFIRHDLEQYLYKPFESVIGQETVIVSDKPNNMFRPVHFGHTIKGFTAKYYGPDIIDCAVVFGGGSHLGGIDIRRDGVSEYHHWPNRTRILMNRYEFDFVGDKTYALSRTETTPYPYNESL